MKRKTLAARRVKWTLKSPIFKRCNSRTTISLKSMYRSLHSMPLGRDKRKNFKTVGLNSILSQHLSTLILISYLTQALSGLTGQRSTAIVFLLISERKITYKSSRNLRKTSRLTPTAKKESKIEKLAFSD